ncbi:MAG: prolipoprotein diacylglyceryl transferase [Rhodospirillales bacterium]|nr:prolipoprotein diacylglyceryl transferase [Rhodospirillales bacterium]
MALTYPEIDPVAIRLGPLAIRWYGLAYITGLVLGWRYTVWLARQKRFNGPDSRPTATDLDDFLFWAMAGVLIGGRLGIVLFYKPHEYFADPVSILKIWEGGMSFHGGMLGVVVALILFARRRHIELLKISDLVACAAPIGLFFGRLANFVNGELWGRVTDSPLGMVFPTGGPEPRHPSQLYEAASEGVILFLVLAILAQQPAIRRRHGLLTGLFLVGYSIARSTCELFREPDSYLGFIVGGISMGQILSFPMLLVGLGLVIYATRRPVRAAVQP